MLGAIILAASIPTQLPPPPAVDPTAPASASAPESGGAAGGPRFAFEVRDIQVEGLDWRGVLKGKTRRLGWQAGVSIWAIDERTARSLIEHVQKSPRTVVLQAPPAVAEAGQAARTLTGSTVQLVVDLERRADGPPGQESGIAYLPILEQMHNGVDLSLSATPDADGLVVGLNLDESTIQGIHTGSFEDAVDGPSPAEDRPILGLFRRRAEEDPNVSRAGAMKLQASFQVPEVVRSHVEGAWPLKPGELLLVSLGARTTAEKWGRPVVVERLVLVSARPEGVAGRRSMLGAGPVGETGAGGGAAASPFPSLPSASTPDSAPPPPIVPGLGGPGGILPE
ncbi:hypothetical protein [Tautonia sociabilis]|uniref:Type II and III secretion system protein n=1 Tax=Tautonia sociabilis TaxID=2080755 RepID=A0A432MK35_9BACT|nr:hypothetical protein [Tautonia sociabilis]RUL87761.1 hypothetical protein TsocGM_10375 [Tautonia sociabilis]